MKAVPQNGLVYKWFASETGPFTGNYLPTDLYPAYVVSIFLLL